MAQFRKAVITQKGLALIQKTQLRNSKLEFTKIATGSGRYAESEELSSLEVLKEPMQEFSFLSVTAVEAQTIKLTSVLSNKTLTQAYYMREIGVFASDPDEGEILYSLSVAYPGKADYLPAYDGLAPVTIGLDTYQSVSNAENVIIQVSPGAYALAKDLERLVVKVNDMDNEIGANLDLIFDLAEVENQFKIVYFGGTETDQEALTTTDVEEATTIPWDGQPTEDETALTITDVEEATTIPWDGQPTEDETALTITDVEEATKMN